MKTLFCILSFSLLASPCFSQKLNTPTLSPFSSVKQQVGLTELSLEYSRPSAKGRKVFGELVPFDQLWRTGANASSKLTLLEPAMIAGHAIEPGTYAIYTIPGKKEWTVIFHSNTKLRSLAGGAYQEKDDVFRWVTTPQKTTDYVETFTMQFQAIKSNSCSLQLVWENTSMNIPIEFDVDSKVVQQMSEFLENPETIPHRTYFEAAQYYLNNNKSLQEALSFIKSALVKSPKNFRYGLLQSKIEAALGDYKTAIQTIEDAQSWAEKAQNANYIEQTTLYKKALLKKKNP